VDELRSEVRRLRRAERQLRSDHAAEIREMKDSVVTYANQIQVLTLANAELRHENERLRHCLDTATPNVIPLSGRSP
jgi:hypothetical protein